MLPMTSAWRILAFSTVTSPEATRRFIIVRNTSQVALTMQRPMSWSSDEPGFAALYSSISFSIAPSRCDVPPDFDSTTLAPASMQRLAVSSSCIAVKTTIGSAFCVFLVRKVLMTSRPSLSRRM